MVFVTENFEDDTLDLAITGTWTRTNATAGTGSWSMRSAPIDHNQMTEMVVQVPAGATHLSFKIRLSTEGGAYDPFELYGIDAVGSYVLLDEAWGVLDWYTWLTAVPVDSYTAVAFRYSRDSSDGGGENAVFVDDIVFFTAAPSPPAAVANNFNHGVAGQPLTPDSSGGENGLPFSVSGNVHYTDEAPRLPGGLAAVNPGPDLSATFSWADPPGMSSSNAFYVRAYWYRAEDVDTSSSVFTLYGPTIWFLDLWASGGSLYLDVRASRLTVGEAPAGQWIRIELALLLDSPGVGHAEAWVYYQHDATVPDVHVTSGTITFEDPRPNQYSFYVKRDSLGKHWLLDDIAVGSVKLGPVGPPATEAIAAVVASDTSQPLPRLAKGDIGSASGAEVAQSLHGARQRLLPASTDAAAARMLHGSKGWRLAAARNLDHARPLHATKIFTLGTVVEVNEGRRLFADISLGLAHDQSRALPLVPRRVKTLHPAVHADAAQPLPLGRGRAPGQTVTNDIATRLRWTKTQTVGFVLDRSLPGVFSPFLPPLAVDLPHRLWGVSAPELLRGVVVDPISSLSLEYVRVFVKHARGTEPVEIAFTTPGVEPGPADWKTASWAETKNRGAIAHILVGPNGTVTLADGTYQVWVRTVRQDERPVLPSGLIPII
ncbi:hypothetical protein [Nonomuraea endophytica]|uniref:Uncharacterized protein n=1 Tax=Nonomuraea endophytica TaxID=714136 RepID=A0A7W8AAR6_9ACTN|nr:hypothetical protein [Nonomuraea endophytica]MBB5081363.1 hypothetical protein [Nonomuraea endophytica]